MMFVPPKNHYYIVYVS